MKPMLLAIISVLSLAACKSASVKKTSANPSRLNGTWQLSYIDRPGTTVAELYPDKKPKITFDATASSVSGNTGCNSFAGPVTLKGSTLNFDQPLVTTKMFCPGDGETAFLETLNKVKSWSIRDAVVLELIGSDEPLMRFTKIQ